MQQSISRFFKPKQGIDANKSSSEHNVVKEEHIPSAPTNDSSPEKTPLKRKTTVDQEKSLKKAKINRGGKSSETKPKGNRLTEFEQQIQSFKLDHLDKLLLIQSGYRYKFFGEDARIASTLLSIKLTEGKLSYDLDRPARDDHLYSTFAQASIPIERLLVHIRRLLAKGYKVGIVDQIETSSIKSEEAARSEGSRSKTKTGPKSKVFKRKLTNVYSPGTFIDDDDLDKNVNGKSILCINESAGGNLSIVSVNVYFHEIIYDQLTDNFIRSKLDSVLHHLEPIEILTFGNISENTLNCIESFKVFNSSTNLSNLVHLPLKSNFVPINEVLSFFESELSSSSEIEEDDEFELFSFLSDLDHPLLLCFQKIYIYLSEFNLGIVFNKLSNYKTFSSIDNNLILNSHVLKNLEIFNNLSTFTANGSLFEILNHTSTKFGERLLKNWISKPLINRDLIGERQEAIGSLFHKLTSLQMEKVVNILETCPDLELILSRVYYKRTTRKEVYLFLKNMINIKTVFQNLHYELISLDSLSSSLLFELFRDIRRSLIDDNNNFNILELFEMINSQHALDTKSDDHITEYFNLKFFNYAAISEQRSKINDIKYLLMEELKEIRKITKNKDLNYTKVGNEAYLIQIRKSNIKEVPQDWLLINDTAHCKRFRTPQINQLYKKLQYNEELLKRECDFQFDQFINKINKFYLQFSSIIKKLAVFDVLISLTKSCIHNNFTKPKIVDEPVINLKNARNPICEKLLATNNFATCSYIKNDFQLNFNGKGKVSLITGPNMGGKSSFIRQVALICILSQIGCFVPCDEGSVLGIFDNFSIRLGSNDDIFNKNSTFQIELYECKQILDDCKKHKKNLVLLDELGRGTSTLDGFCIASSVLEYFIEDLNKLSDSLVLFVTHFKELAQVANHYPRMIKNYFMGYRIFGPKDISKMSVMFTYKLQEGFSNDSFGIYCAKIAGLDESLLHRADDISRLLEFKQFRKSIQSSIITKDVKSLYDMIDLETDKTM